MTSQRSTPLLIRGVYGLFFLSGALGLVYEVLWLRKLLLVFGSTVHATGTVLTVFFGGLALGSWVFGRLIDRQDTAGLKWYAACEAGIGLYAFATPWLFQAIERIYIPLYRASNFSSGVLVGASFVCTAAILLVPTVLMGGTFPLVSRFLVRSVRERGLTIASLYGVNTAGAVAGTLAVYYVGLQRLGWLATLQCAGLLNLMIGVVARACDRNLRLAGFAPSSERSAKSRPPGPVPLEPDVLIVLAAFGLSGFAAMAYEVAWTRGLSLVLGSSVYAFCLMLATFLAGIALGSFAARLSLRATRARPDDIVLLEMALAVYGLFSIPLFGWLPEWFVTLWPLFGGSFTGLSALQAALSVAVMALPTFFMGLLFPIVGDLVTGHLAQLGRRLGLAYAVNTLGGILGSFLCGFWLIPQLGIAWTLVIAALINLASGLTVYVRFSAAPALRRIALAAGSVAVYLGLGWLVFVPSWQRQVLAAGAYLQPESFREASVADAARESEILFYRESLNATVSVHRNRNSRHLFLKVGGKTDASTGVDMGTQILLAQIPMAIHPNPKRVLVIGLGSGVTVGSVGRHPVSAIDCAEIDPAVVEGARYFADYNHRIHEDPRVQLHVADGRNFLLAHPASYDVIIVELSNPWMAGIANLYTKEFFELCRRRLAPGGIMCQWLHLYRIFPSDVKLILKTFQEVFPATSVWSTVPGDIVAVGSVGPHQLEYGRLERLLAVPAIREDLDRIRLTHPLAFLESFWLGPEQVRRLTADVGWAHTDDHPELEFSAPKALYSRAAFKTNYDGMKGLKAPASAIAPEAPDAEQDAAFHLALARAAQFREEPDAALQAFERALELEPDDAAASLELGRLAAQRGLTGKAEAALRRAMESDARNPDAHYEWARLLWRQERFDDALKHYERAAALAVPDSAQAEEIGNAFRFRRHWEKAADYLQAAARDGAAPSASLALGGTLKELGRYDEAVRVLEPASEQPAGALALAKVYQAQGRAGDAERLLLRVVKQAPKTAEAYFGLGAIALDGGDLGRARRWLIDGLRYDPYNAKALELLQMARRP